MTTAVASEPTTHSNGQQATQTPEFSYRDQSVYSASITDQGVSQSKNGHLQVVLRIRIQGQLKKPDSPNAGMIVPPEGTPTLKTVYLTYGPSEVSRDQFVRELASTGFKGQNPFVDLDPARKGFEDLRGRNILARYDANKSDPSKDGFWHIHRIWETLKVNPIDPQALKSFRENDADSFKEAMNKARASNQNPVQDKGF